MRIRVKGYLNLREMIGDRLMQERVNDEVTLKDILDELELELGSEFAEMIFDPKTGGVNKYIAILINGQHHTHLPDKLDTALEDGDEVAIFPPMAGG